MSQNVNAVDTTISELVNKLDNNKHSKYFINIEGTIVNVDSTIKNGSTKNGKKWLLGTIKISDNNGRFIQIKLWNDLSNYVKKCKVNDKILITRGIAQNYIIGNRQIPEISCNDSHGSDIDNYKGKSPMEEIKNDYLRRKNYLGKLTYEEERFLNLKGSKKSPREYTLRRGGFHKNRCPRCDGIMEDRLNRWHCPNCKNVYEQ